MGEEKQAVRLVANKWFCFFFSFYRFLDLLQPFRRLLLGTRLRVVVQSVDALVDGLQVGHSLHRRNYTCSRGHFDRFLRAASG